MPYIVLDPSTAAAAPTVTIGAPLTSVGETLSTMRTELDLELGRRSDYANPADLNYWINKAYRKVAGMLTVKELFGSFQISTVSTQPFYALPIQVAWIKRVSLRDATNYPIEGGREMEQIDENIYRDLAVYSAIPTRWFRWRRMLVLWGTPNAVSTVSVDCRVRPDDLSANTDSPLLPPEFHEVILLYAKATAFRALRIYNEAATASNDALSILRPLLNTDAEELAQAESTVSPARSKGDLYWGRSS
jgi:hypothetical protein